MKVLHSAFSEESDYERVLCHILYGILKDSSRISWDNFIMKSFTSYVLSDVPAESLHCDTQFFAKMGRDMTRLAFLRAFVKAIQKGNPNFCKGYYVESTPLPNDIDNNPFNALSCYGMGSCEVMVRLVLVLDEAIGLPVWYDIIPGNVLDVNTIMNVVNDVADSLGIVIDSLVLDSGYVTQELISAFHIGANKTMIGCMPVKERVSLQRAILES